MLVSLAPLAVGAGQFSATTNGVRLDVLALDGRVPRLGLTRDHFEVRDNGVLQTLEAVSSTDAAHVVVVLDVSGSVQGEPLQRLTEAADALLARLTPKDRLTLVGFSHHLKLLTPRQNRVPTDTLPLGGSTALHDAVFASVLLAGEDRRPALMILLTDGLDSASWVTQAQALDMTHRADVVIYPVITDYDLLLASGSQTVGRARRGLEQLADDTGGRLFPVSARRPLTAAFLEILDEYRHRYILTYTPRGADQRGWHEIEVRLKGVRGTAHTRRGYTVP